MRLLLGKSQKRWGENIHVSSCHNHYAAAAGPWPGRTGPGLAGQDQRLCPFLPVQQGRNGPTLYFRTRRKIRDRLFYLNVLT